MGRNVVMGGLAAFAAAVLLALSMVVPEEEDSWARILREGEVRVGHTAEAPYAFRDEAGQVTGEGPAVAAALLAQLGIKRIRWIRSDFGSLIPKLQGGRFDVVAAGMFITPARREQVAFVHPGFCVASALLVRRGNPLGLDGLDVLARRDSARLAVLAGAVEGEAARRAGVPPDRIEAFPDPDTALAALRAGLVDALALSAPTIQWLADRNADLQRAPSAPEEGRGQGCGALVVRLGDQRLWAALDRAMVAYRGSPPHLALVRPFGFLPEDVRSAQEAYP